MSASSGIDPAYYEKAILNAVESAVKSESFKHPISEYFLFEAQTWALIAIARELKRRNDADGLPLTSLLG